MNLFLAIGLGIAGGILGVIPFIVARSRIKARLKKDGVGSIVTGMAAVCISTLIMVIEIVLFHFIVGDYLLPFAISAIAVFLLAMGAYTATLMKR